MAQYDPTETSQLVKQVFDEKEVKNLTYTKNPLVGRVKKTQTGGASFECAFRYGMAGSRSRDISKSLQRKKPAKFARFSVPMVKDYNSISLDRMFTFSTEKPKWAFLSARVEEVKHVLEHLKRSLGISLYRGTGGSCGRIATNGVSTNTITLKNIEEVSNFEVGDYIVISSANGNASADALEVQAQDLIITGVNRSTGVLTFNVAVTTAVPTATSDYYLFKDGDFQASMAGLEAWNPVTAPTSTDSFYGQNRFADITRLAGHRVTATSSLISEAVGIGAAFLGREGKSPDTVLMSHRRMRDLIFELDAKVQYTSKDATDAKVGFKGVTFASPAGELVCHADVNCPDTELRIIKLDSIEVLYTGSAMPELQEDDGSIYCREAGSDSLEVRASYYANMRSNDPSEACVVTLAA